MIGAHLEDTQVKHCVTAHLGRDVEDVGGFDEVVYARWLIARSGLKTRVYTCEGGVKPLVAWSPWWLKAQGVVDGSEGLRDTKRPCRYPV